MFKPWSFYAKKDICRNPPIFVMILVSGLSPFIASAYDISDFRQKVKWKHKLTVNVITFTSDVCFQTVTVYRNRSTYCSIVLRRCTSWPISRRVNLTSVLKSQIPFSIFTPSTSVALQIFEKSMLRYPLPPYLELCMWLSNFEKKKT